MQNIHIKKNKMFYIIVLYFKNIKNSVIIVSRNIHRYNKIQNTKAYIGTYEFKLKILY